MGYFGDRCDKAAAMHVVCSKDFISISVIEDFFSYYSVDVDSIHLLNSSCRAKKENTTGSVYYTVQTPKEQYEACGGRPVQKNLSHIAYSLMLMSDPQVYENIVRDPVIKIEYTCVYPYIHNVSLPFPILPFSSELVMQVGELEVKMELSLFKDQTYTEAFRSTPTVQLRDRVFVQVSVTEPQDFFNLRVDECWATQTPKPNKTLSLFHTLLLNGCVNDETVSFLSKATNYRNGTVGQEGHNGQGSTVRFSFDMFRFVTEPHELYLHCSVQLCTQDHAGSCITECKSIIKREAAMREPPQGLLSYGPIRVQVPERPMFNYLLTLVLPLGVLWILAIFFLILISFAKAGNKHLALQTNL
ncbi:zona pellucida glycoprotein d [Salminus brasiliensis]|uniref:zona pellucida glycoprotein d n=1 Tax=Salminus brasiliensis TaxID=930266 RepID=UPI003B835A2A